MKTMTAPLVALLTMNSTASAASTGDTPVDAPTRIVVNSGYHELVQVVLQNAADNAGKNGESEAFVGCIKNVQAAHFVPLMAKLVAEQMEPAEIDEADRFFTVPAAQTASAKVARYLIADYQEKKGMAPHRPAQELTQDEQQVMDRFLQTNAGAKIYAKGVFFSSSAALDALAREIRQISADCRRLSGTQRAMPGRPFRWPL
ncbi:hypothetical protein TSA66_24685 [Noviherbaspirillum autotrophicum]|uniref:DUF2059 domain-containing protein n=2 Tax=Noviherbaspirillum autotrophicum TaxID=709839 RepID=A0A0C2BPT2_9BURK|nr:hypothetical protein TSA66_24685 [Noviherbaspirillum autotrophicum]